MTTLTTFQDLDNIAFSLLKKLEAKAVQESSEPQQSSKDLHGIPFIFDLGEISSFVAHSTDGWGNTDSMFLNENGKTVGFGKENYKLIKEIAAAFLELDERYNYTDQEFIEKEIFEWVISVYKTNKAESNLTSYLEKRVNEETKDYTFYFKLYPVGIEGPFTFGRLRILPFTEDFLLEQYQRLPLENRKSWEKYKEGFREFLNSVVVEITVKAVASKAEIIARADASLIINAFKCFLNPESCALSYQLFDLDFKATVTGFSHSIVKYNEQGGLTINLKRLNGTLPIELTYSNIERLKKSGLETMHNFLILNKKTEFYLLILRGIDQFGIAVSTRNLYDRMVQFTSFFELFLNDENSSRSKAETFLKSKVLPLLISDKDQEIAKSLVRMMYNIRDKYLHNRILITLDIEDMLKVQGIALRFLLLMMRVSDKITNKLELFEHLEIPH